MKRLNPKNPYLHQRPKQKGFNIDKHDPNMEIVYFDNAKVGINAVGKYMPVVRNYFSLNLVKFIYSEKGTKFCKISTLLLSYEVPVKSKVKISQNFVAFSEYMNFNRTV